MATYDGVPFVRPIVGPADADINVGYLSHTSTTGATTLLTVPAGRTWAGTVTIVAAVAKDAAATTTAQARAVIATAGTGVVPAAGTILACEAKAGANAVGGVTGSQGGNSIAARVVVRAPVGNAVTLTLVSTVAGTAGVLDVSAIGENQ